MSRSQIIGHRTMLFKRQELFLKHIVGTEFVKLKISRK